MPDFPIPGPGPLLLGLEIGGTKLQLGLGTGDGRLRALARLEIAPPQVKTSRGVFFSCRPAVVICITASLFFVYARMRSR